MTSSVSTSPLQRNHLPVIEPELLSPSPSHSFTPLQAPSHDLTWPVLTAVITTSALLSFLLLLALFCFCKWATRLKGLGRVTCKQHNADLETGAKGQTSELSQEKQTPTHSSAMPERLPLVKYKVGKMKARCTICSMGFKDGEIYRTMPGCGHVFHYICVDPLLVRRPTCPICPTSIKSFLHVGNGIQVLCDK